MSALLLVLLGLLLLCSRLLLLLLELFFFFCLLEDASFLGDDGSVLLVFFLSFVGITTAKNTPHYFQEVCPPRRRRCKFDMVGSVPSRTSHLRATPRTALSYTTEQQQQQQQQEQLRSQRQHPEISSIPAVSLTGKIPELGNPDFPGSAPCVVRPSSTTEEPQCSYCRSIELLQISSLSFARLSALAVVRRPGERYLIPV